METLKCPPVMTGEEIHDLSVIFVYVEVVRVHHGEGIEVE